MTTTTTVLAFGLCATAAIYIFLWTNRLRGYRLRKLDHWTREFYKAMDPALACPDIVRAINVIEVMNDSVANPRSALIWVLVFSQIIKRAGEHKKLDFDLSGAPPELQKAVAHCVITGVMAAGYRSHVTEAVLRSLMADFIAEPPRAVEFAGKFDLRSRIRRLQSKPAAFAGAS